MERAARMSGARFGYWLGDTARLALALYRFALDRLAEKGFVTALPPVLVREDALIGTGAFPSDEANVYELPADGLYLAGTAEIPLASLHAGEILDADELPLRYAAFSPCFRREAGAAGRDTRGMFRVHQFNKVEQFSFTRPADSADEHEFLLANTEELVGALGLPYRVVVLPAGDMSSASAKTYDVEIWFPSQDRYRETASVSNTTDFQARRLGIRYRGERGVEPVHIAERHCRRRPDGARDPREPRRRRARRARAVRRSRARRAVSVTELEHALGLVRDVYRGRAGHRVPLPWGELLVCDDLPRVYDANLALVERWDGDAVSLAGEIERAAAAAGLRHRRVLVHDQQLAERLWPQLPVPSWPWAERNLVMIRRRPADRVPDPARRRARGRSRHLRPRPRADPARESRARRRHGAAARRARRAGRPQPSRRARSSPSRTG